MSSTSEDSEKPAQTGKRANLFVIVLLSAVLCLPGAALGEVEGPLKKIKLKHKADVVEMENGDRNAGEIKKMEYGMLYLKSDRAADTLKLDWVRVTRGRERSPLRV